MSTQTTKMAIKRQFALYCEWLGEQQYSRTTRQCYSSRASQFVAFLLGNPSDPLDLEVEAERYCQTLQDERYAPTSINATITVLETFLPPLLSKSVKFPRFQGMEPALIALTKEEQELLLQAIRTKCTARDRFLLFLLFHCGIRIGALTNLNLNDLVISAHSGRRLAYPHNAIDSSVRLEALLGMESDEPGAAQHKVVRLNDETRRAGLQWLIERETLVGNNESALFLNSSAKRLTSAGISHIVRSFGWKLQIELNSRILRNTYLANLEVNAEPENFSSTNPSLVVAAQKDPEKQFAPIIMVDPVFHSS